MDIIILLYDGFTALDFVGPFESLSRFPGANVKFVSKEKGLIEGEHKHLKILTEYSIKDIDRADILVVPGATLGFLKAAQDPEILTWIRKIHETTKRTTSVCSGSVILAASGILNGLQVTSHWAVYDQIQKLGAIPVAERIVRNGKIITSAGVSAGIDMGLHLAALEHGEEFAKMLQLVIEYDPRPDFDSGSVAKSAPSIIEKAKNFLRSDIKRLSGGTFLSVLLVAIKLKFIHWL